MELKAGEAPGIAAAAATTSQAWLCHSLAGGPGQSVEALCVSEVVVAVPAAQACGRDCVRDFSPGGSC